MHTWVDKLTNIINIREFNLLKSTYMSKNTVNVSMLLLYKEQNILLNIKRLNK